MRPKHPRLQRAAQPPPPHPLDHVVKQLLLWQVRVLALQARILGLGVVLVRGALHAVGACSAPCQGDCSIGCGGAARQLLAPKRTRPVRSTRTAAEGAGAGGGWRRGRPWAAQPGPKFPSHKLHCEEQKTGKQTHLVPLWMHHAWCPSRSCRCHPLLPASAAVPDCPAPLR